jgi:hypothetical protein
MSHQGSDWRDPLHIKALFEEAKQNAAHLDGCAGPHQFAPVDPAVHFLQRYRCVICHSVVERTAYIWYTRGLTHGQKP